MSKRDIATVLIVMALAGAILSFGRRDIFVKNVEVKIISAPILPSVQQDDQRIYDIDKIKPRRQSEPAEEPTDLEGVYRNSAKEGMGGNMIEKWSRINPETKTKLMAGLTETIEKTKEELKVNPGDKQARSRLVISEMLKNLALNNFNIKFKDVKSGGK